MTRPWWQESSLAVADDALTMDGRPLAELARAHGTPLYVLSLAQVRRQLAAIEAALASTGRPFRIQYAMKANRHLDLLRCIHQAGAAIDVCSPREAARALLAGFAPSQVSATASMLSDRDLDAFVAMGVHLNLDARSALRRYGARVPPGTAVGLRFDPVVEVGYGGGRNVSYGNAKFGFSLDAAGEAIAFATTCGLRVDTLHVHLGWGLQAEAEASFRAVVRRLVAIAAAAPSVQILNVGGGLGARRREEDTPLDLTRWAAVLAEELAGSQLTIACEPGTLVVDAAGVLVVEVTTVEPRTARTWIGVDAGHNLHVYAAHYGLPVRFVPVRAPLAPADRRYAIAGNINEAGDVFGLDHALPEVREGDLLALFPAGAYGSSMASDHCLRGMAAEVVLP